ncbi:hypothetical protein CYMTET_52390 [Cymbomonas tetramitiformis]|uniref:Uncharacterized protein n=1 Tax=Cymbomonas tetramitiformis TaxID=36881 RepID=A0AAE0BK97_9CHLO|nr:hypothetical protein CYMTET_52390 [Cymbomonas tetramitiformis]
MRWRMVSARAVVFLAGLIRSAGVSISESAKFRTCLESPETDDCLTLDFENSGLTGTIPSELGNLELLDLRLEGNFLSGTVPSEMGKLSRMTAM